MSAYHPAAHALQALISLSNEIERELAAALGLNLTDYRALAIVAMAERATVGVLAGRLAATPATTTAIVNRLEAHGYVARQRSDDDRRLVHVSVTRSALEHIMGLMLPLMAATDRHLRTLPAEHQRVVEDFLGVTVRLMDEHRHALAGEES